MDFYGYTTRNKRPKAFQEIIDVLQYLINNNMIEVKQPLHTLSFDTGIEIKIIPENFDYTEYFSRITSSQLGTICRNDTKLNRESILMAFLYINSYIGCRPKNDDGSEKMYNPETKPEAFWRSIESMAKDLSMSKDTITQCLDFLTSSDNNRPALLIKREVGSIQPDPKKPPKNIPNIYVLNKKGYKHFSKHGKMKTISCIYK